MYADWPERSERQLFTELVTLGRAALLRCEAGESPRNTTTRETTEKNDFNKH